MIKIESKTKGFEDIILNFESDVKPKNLLKCVKSLIFPFSLTKLAFTVTHALHLPTILCALEHRKVPIRRCVSPPPPPSERGARHSSCRPVPPAV